MIDIQFLRPLNGDILEMLETMMKRFILAGLFAMSLSAPATAQYYVTYVSSSGQDANGCGSAEGSCRSFSQASALTAIGGTIVCLDAGLYSASNGLPLTITKSINIDCSAAGTGATFAARTDAGSVSPIVINIPASSADPLRRVRIRGLSFQGAVQVNGATVRATRGIEIVAANEVFLDNVSLADYAQQGIYDHRTAGQTRLFVKDSAITGNGGPGIVAASQSPAVTVLDNVSLLNNAYGVAAATGNNVVVTRSTISGSTTAGVHADTGAQVNVLNSVLSHNTSNINANGTVRLRENDIQFSNTAIVGSGAVSAGGNRFLGNVSMGTTPSLASGAPADVFN